jgi:hypothetical protein
MSLILVGGEGMIIFVSQIVEYTFFSFPQIILPQLAGTTKAVVYLGTTSS